MITGSFTAIGGSLILGWLFSISPIILIFGAITQPYTRYVGKLMVALGAVMLTSEVVILAFAIPSGIRLLQTYHDRYFLAILSFSMVSVSRVTWCDIVLVKWIAAQNLI